MGHTSLPKPLVRDIENGECVIFLGAGASTEGSNYFGKNLVEVLAEKCNYPSRSALSLPQVARYFCDVLDGGFKGRLIREIRDYIDRFMEYGEAHNVATTVHRTISRIGLLKVIVTTNWDVFMERELNLLPIVRDADLVYWRDDRRQVVKLHGCLSQPDTMIVTEDDYKEFVRSQLNSPISNKIKDLMATKTFLFLGYSLNDESFQLIHDEVLSKMGKFSRVSYAVLENPTEKSKREWKRKGVIIISSYAIPLLSNLDRVFIENGTYFDDDFRTKVSSWMDRVYDVHFSTGQTDEIGLLSMMYQDGLQHSLSDLYYGIAIGKSKKYYRERLEFFSSILKAWIKKGDLIEVAYSRGRVETYKWALEARKKLRLYCSPEFRPIDRDEFLGFRKGK